MAFDSRTGSFFIGSMHRRKIVRRDRDGRVRDWAGPERGLWSILGIKIDASRGELWANSCNMGDELPMTPADPATVGRRRAPSPPAHRRERPPPLRAGRHGAAHLLQRSRALTGRGCVRHRRPRRALALAAGWRHARAADPGYYALAQRIATGPGGALYVADDSMGPLLVDPTSGRWRRVTAPEGATLRGIDGLYVHDGALVWIQNGVEPARVVRARLAGDGATLGNCRCSTPGIPTTRCRRPVSSWAILSSTSPPPSSAPSVPAAGSRRRTSMRAERDPAAADTAALTHVPARPPRRGRDVIRFAQGDGRLTPG